MGQFHFHPDEYLALMHAELPGYERLQDALVAASRGIRARAILELGSGSGETTRRLLDAHPEAALEGLDASEDMLTAARGALAGRPARLRAGRIEDPLPQGPFDLVASALTVHHVDGPAKADLFRSVAAVLRPGGRFVLADVVVPDDPADAVAPLSPELDLPSRADEQLAWLAAAGLEPRLAWAERDLAVLVGDRPSD